MKNIGVSIIAFCSLLFLTLSSCKKKDNDMMMNLYKSGYRNPDLIGSWKLIRSERVGGIVYEGEDSLIGRGLEKIIFHSDGDYQILRFDNSEKESDFKKYWYNPDEHSYKVYYKAKSLKYGNDEETRSFALNATKDTLRLVYLNSTAYYIRY